MIASCCIGGGAGEGRGREEGLEERGMEGWGWDGRGGRRGREGTTHGVKHSMTTEQFALLKLESLANSIILH